jgi:hypothetical protein
MPKQIVRFGVSGQTGFRAETWKCWTSHGAGKRQDVYVACRRLGNALKLSLHESGRWHMAFDSQQFSQMFEEANAPPDRFMGKWEKPAPLITGLTLACRIHIPWYAATIPDLSLDSPLDRMCPAGSVGRGLCVSVGAPPRQLGLAGSRLHANQACRPISARRWRFCLAAVAEGIKRSGDELEDAKNIVHRKRSPPHKNP